MSILGRYEGKTVLITGAAGGIGTALAGRFLSEGERVALLDRDAASLDAFAQSAGGRASRFIVDVADEQQTRSTFEAILLRQGRIHAAVLNAGIEGRPASLHELDAAAFDQVMAVNVRGVFLWLSRLMGHMRHAGGGVIAITSSTSGVRGAQSK